MSYLQSQRGMRSNGDCGYNIRIPVKVNVKKLVISIGALVA